MVAPDAREHRAPPEARGERLDQFLARVFPDLTRSRIQGLIEAGHAQVDGRPAKVALRLKGGELLSLQIPAPVYLRGMLMSMARELGLDPLRVSRSYMALASSEDRKKR